MPDYKCQPTSSHYIGGQYVEDKAGAPFDCIDPATGKVIAHLHEATPKLIVGYSSMSPSSF